MYWESFATTSKRQPHPNITVRYTMLLVKYLPGTRVRFRISAVLSRLDSTRFSL